MPSEILTCVECKNSFEFSEGEQKYYSEKNFTPPKRCKPCRDRRKALGNNGGPGGGQRPAPTPVVENYAETWSEGRKDNRRRRGGD
jgi:hypothetical protein